MPTFNEVKSLEHVVHTWNESLKNQNLDYVFIICEDGSTDGTKELILEMENKYPIVNESVNERRGYGGGVIAGIKRAKSDYILCIDSDGQCMPDSFIELWNIRNDFDIVIGHRCPRLDPKIRRIYSFLFLALHKLLFGKTVSDPSCPYIITTNKIFKDLMPMLTYMREGFWWGCVGAGKLKKYSFGEKIIKHYDRYDGSTVVYKLSRMPSIIIRNIIGLIKLRFS